jgi:hypothetical protein
VASVSASVDSLTSWSCLLSSASIFWVGGPQGGLAAWSSFDPTFPTY